jgi:hypothetical protein
MLPTSIKFVRGLRNKHVDIRSVVAWLLYCFNSSLIVNIVYECALWMLVDAFLEWQSNILENGAIKITQYPGAPSVDKFPHGLYVKCT